MIPSLHVYQLSSQVDDGWCEGTLKGTGIRGMFPDNFVELIHNRGWSLSLMLYY